MLLQGLQNLSPFHHKMSVHFELLLVGDVPLFIPEFVKLVLQGCQNDQLFSPYSIFLLLDLRKEGEECLNQLLLVSLLPLCEMKQPEFLLLHLLPGID